MNPDALFGPIDPAPQPSIEAIRRKRDILAVVQCAAADRRRIRAVVRGGGMVCAAAFVTAAGILASRATTRPVAPEVASSSVAEQGTPMVAAAPRLVQFVRNDPAVHRLVVSQPAPVAVTIVDDDRLLSDLSRAGVPGGLIRIRGRVLLERDVALSRTDREEPAG